jgi:hypothetical protein
MINDLDLELTPQLILATCQLHTIASPRRTGAAVWSGKSEWQEWMQDWGVCVEFNITDADCQEVQCRNVMSRPAASRFAPENNGHVSFITEGARLEIEFLIPDCLQMLESRNWGAAASGRIVLRGQVYHCETHLSMDALYHTLELRRRSDALEFLENGSTVLTLSNQDRNTIHQWLPISRVS